jgi:acyl carrier protein
MEVEQEIGEILTEMGISPEQLTPEATLAEDLDLDSVELIQFALELEAHFNIEIPDEGVTPNMTLAQVAEKVRELQGV